MPLDEIEPSIDFIKKILTRDRKIFFKDYEDSLKISSSKTNLDENEDNSSIKNLENSEKPIIADFTEYNPFHKGHYHCMKFAKEKVPNGIFVAIVPGLFERSGRGIPYIMTRQARAQAAIDLGVDIVLEGPPMGIMGSGQYSLCLALMFQALNTDFIPRGYRPFEGYDIILDRISQGHGVSPKPYKIVDTTLGEVLFKGKLEEDNYVIVSLSKSLKRVGFDFKDKFLFVERISGVSGSLIREAASSGEVLSLKSMLPSETIAILENEIKNMRAPLHLHRDVDSILDSANNMKYEDLIELNLMDNLTAKKIVSERENKNFETLEEIQNCVSYGFSSHFNHRVLSVLETKINKYIISNYIDNYPQNIRVLNYKNESVLEEFIQKINNHKRRIELCQ